MTPALGRAEAVAWFLDMATVSPVVFDPSTLAQFKEDLVVEINGSDPNRLDFLLPPDLINELVVTAAKIQFLG
jgi:phage tail sheath gpL-like